MPAGIPVIKELKKGFDPTSVDDIASLRAPTDAANSPRATPNLSPRDNLFGLNGTIIRGEIGGTTHEKPLGFQKNKASLRRFEDIKVDVLALIRDMRKQNAERKLFLRAKLISDKALGTSDAELKETTDELARLEKFPVLAFQITCEAPFKSDKDARDPGVHPISVNTFAVLKEFGSLEAVTKANKEMKPVECRPFKGARSEEDLLYTPFWILS